MAPQGKVPANREDKHQIGPERYQRILKIEDCLQRGFTNQIGLSNKFGVSQPQISQDIRWIMRNWVEQDGVDIREKRALRVRQLETITRLGIDGFDRSRQNSMETTTTSRVVTCVDCDGRGVREVEGKKNFCKACGGDGEVAQDIVAQKVKGQAGDPALLSVVNAAIKEINKLEGTVVTRTEHRGVVEGVVLHAHTGTDKTLTSASSEDLIAAKAALFRLAHSTATDADAAFDPNIIDETPSE